MPKFGLDPPLYKYRICNSEGHHFAPVGSNIQVALDELSGVYGGKVWMPSGLFEIEYEVDIARKGTTLQGCGHNRAIAPMGTTIIKQANGAEVANVIHASASNCLIKDLFVDANRANNPLTNTVGIMFNSNNGSIEDTAVINARYIGVRVGGIGVYLKNVFAETCAHGFWLYAVTDSVFVRCGGLYNDGYGWYIYGASVRNIFTGLRAGYNSGSSGVLLEDLNCKWNTFLGMDVSNNQKHGVWLSGAIDNSFIGGFVGDNSQNAHNTYNGVHLSSKNANHCLRNIFTGMQIHSTLANKQCYGIRESDANQDYNIYKANVARYNQTAQISKQGANSIKDNNIEINIL